MSAQIYPIELEIARYVAASRCPNESRSGSGSDKVFESAARQAATRVLTDTVAAMVSGVANQAAQSKVAALLGAETGPSIVAGRVDGTTPPRAALCNGIFAHWCEWDDVHDGAGIHGAAVIFPALLAVAPLADPRQDFLTAAIAAYDVAAMIGREMNTHSFHGWMTTGAAGTIAASAGAAKLMGLDETGILSAMGIAATGAGLTRQALADRTSGKSILCGLAARSAVEAAELARAGIIGAPGFLTGDFGIARLHTGGAVEFGPALERMRASPGTAIAEAGLKPYPSCRSTHPSIDAILELRPKLEDDALIERIIFTVPSLPFALCGQPFVVGNDPRVAAQFSIAFTAALALRNGQLGPEDFLPDAVLRFATRERNLITKITVTEISEERPSGQETVPSHAEIKLIDGRSLSTTITAIRGSASNPLDHADIETKLRLATSSSFAKETVQTLQSACEPCEKDGPADLLACLSRLVPVKS